MNCSVSRHTVLVCVLFVLLCTSLSNAKIQGTTVGSLYSIYLNHDDTCLFGRVDVVNKVTGEHIRDYSLINPKTADQFSLKVDSLGPVMNCSTTKALFTRTSAYSADNSAFYWSPGYHEGGTFVILLSGNVPHEITKIMDPYDAGGVWAMANDDINDIVYQLDSNRLLSVRPEEKMSKTVAAWNNTAFGNTPSVTQAVFTNDGHFKFVHSNRKALMSVDISSNTTSLIACSQEVLDLQYDADADILYSISKGDGCIDVKRFKDQSSCTLESLVTIKDTSNLVTSEQVDDLLFVGTYNYLHVIDTSSGSVSSIPSNILQFLVTFQFATK